MPEERRTQNSKHSTRGYKAPKWFVKLFRVQTFEDQRPTRGYSGVSAIQRILYEVLRGDESKDDC